MNHLDWTVVLVYLGGLLGMSFYLGRGQRDEKDYYLGGNDVNYWAVAISTMASQCSTNSLLGAPAFVIGVGGLLWLQYELALPLAMIGIMLLIVPFFRKLNLVSIYEYLEMRFGVGARTLLSVMFQLLRAFSTGVTIYGISLVLQRIFDVPFTLAVLLLGVVTVVYDFFGGMKAVIYSDVLQMVILLAGLLTCFFYAVHLCGGFAEVWSFFPTASAHTLDFNNSGLGDNQDYSFWPMLFGGVFLYMSYYGCDQTQVQRELSTKNLDDTNMSLFLNGLMRFPLTFFYCMTGVAIAVYMIKHPFLKQTLWDPDLQKFNFNLALPVFCLKTLPHGVIGLVIVALFAAAMSSLDSTINSLSATTMRDIIERFFVKGKLSMGRQLLMSRLTTVFWGALCIFFSFFVGNVADSVLEAVNKIGSLSNGPILAVFLLGVLTRKANELGVICGLLSGFAVNLCFWIWIPSVSWMWWNVIGCLICFSVGYGVSLLSPLAWIKRIDADALVMRWNAVKQFDYKRNWNIYYMILAGYFVLMVVFLLLLELSFKWAR